MAKNKDPPRKGRVTVYRFKNGEEVYNHNLEAGQLVDINSSRFGIHNSVKLTKITHEITPETWRILADSTLDPQLYSTMLADVMRRIHQLEQEDSSGEVINSVTTITSYFETVSIEPAITTLNPEEDYGFGLSGWGSCEWEGE